MRRLIAALLALTMAAGCAPSRRTPPVAEPSPPTVTVTQPSTPAGPPPPPPVSVGPRPELREERRPATAPPPPPPPPPTVPAVAPSDRGRQIVLNFDSADIETVINAVSEIVGFNYVLSPEVRGQKVTVQTSGRIPQEDVFGVLLAILEVQGFTAVKSGNLYKIVRIEGARERAVPTIVGTTPDPARSQTDEVITQIVPVRFASVTDLLTLVRPLISSRGSLIGHRETNVLIITDVASNVARVLDIIRLVDVEVATEELQIIQISFADARELAQILTQLVASGRLRSGLGAAPGAVPAPAPTPGVPVAPGAPGAPGRPAAPDTSAVERPPLIIAEPRSNSLIVHARKNEMETVKRLIGQLDVNIYGGRRVFIYFAESAKAKDLVATLNSIYGAATTGAQTTTPTTPAGAPPPPPPPPGTRATTPPAGAAPGAPPVGQADVGVAEGQLRFIADEATNSVIVTTYPRQWQDVEATIKQLDKQPRQVLIEVLIAEITLTDETRLGLDWAIKAGKINIASTTSNTGVRTTIPTSPPLATDPPSQLLTAPSNIIPTNPAAFFGPIGAGLTAFAFASDQFFAILNALASENRINVVSNPHIMTSENKKAVINVSRSVPVVTSQQTGTTTTAVAGAAATAQPIGSLNQTVEYKDAGVILTVTPRIGERGTVALDVKQEVNDVGQPRDPTGSPDFIKREAETSVVLVNNQTLVLGGLISERKDNVRRGVPFLKDIPVIGFLFGFTEKIIDRRELLMLITPRVVGTALDAQRITDEMRRTTPELDRAIRSAPRPPTNAPPPPPPN